MAQEAGVRKLVLVRMGPSLSSQTQYEHAYSEMQRIYQEEILFSEELLDIELK